MLLFRRRSLRVVNSCGVKEVPGKKAQTFAVIGTFIIVSLSFCGFFRRGLFDIGFNRTFKLFYY